jgi:hypothetical protein
MNVLFDQTWCLNGALVIVYMRTLYFLVCADICYMIAYFLLVLTSLNTLSINRYYNNKLESTLSPLAIFNKIVSSKLSLDLQSMQLIQVGTGLATFGRDAKLKIGSHEHCEYLLKSLYGMFM